MYGFASDYRLPHHIVRPNALDVKLGANSLEAKVFVEIRRHDTRVAPEETSLLGTHMVEAGMEKIAVMALSAYLWGRGHSAQAERSAR